MTPMDVVRVKNNKMSSIIFMVRVATLLLIVYVLRPTVVICYDSSAVSSTNLGSILVFASCVIHRSPVFTKCS